MPCFHGDIYLEASHVTDQYRNAHLTVMSMKENAQLKLILSCFVNLLEPEDVT